MFDSIAAHNGVMFVGSVQVASYNLLHVIESSSKREDVLPYVDSLRISNSMHQLKTVSAVTTIVAFSG